MQAQLTLAELGRTYTQWSAEEARFNAILDRKMEIAHAEQRGERKGVKQNTLKLARKMKAMGYTENDIAEITELSLEQIAQL